MGFLGGANVLSFLRSSDGLGGCSFAVTMEEQRSLSLGGEIVQ